MSINIDERTGDGEYRDVIAAAEFHRKRFGTAPNALVQIARASPLYAEAKEAMGSEWPGEVPTTKRPNRKGKQ